MGLKRGVRTMGVKGQKDNAGIRVEKKIGQSSTASATIKITLKVIVVWLTMRIQRFYQMIYHKLPGGLVLPRYETYYSYDDASPTARHINVV